MKTWTEFTSEINEDGLLLILADYKEFKQNGAIGECFLRSKAKEWCDILDCGDWVAENMKDLANYANAHFAQKYFELAGIDI